MGKPPEMGVPPEMTADPHPPELRRLVTRAVGRGQRRLSDEAPTLARLALEWQRALAGGAPPEAYFLHPGAFPMVLLPWWLESTIRDTPEPRFQADVVYSTISGYYFVRMIDDLMDGERPAPAPLLPVLTFLYAEFQQTYYPYFPHDHPFWEACRSATLASAEMAARDAELSEIDRTRFLEISARKVAGARVPIAAVCHRYGRTDLVGPWFTLVDLLGRWHQMLNDIRGWSRDLGAGRQTYFLSQASASVGPNGSIAEWVIGDGLTWGAALLEEWMSELRAAASDLGSPALVAYLGDRASSLATEWEGLQPSLVAVRHLASIMR
jgi:hypothetical protein